VTKPGVRAAMRWLMAAFYAAAGALHLGTPEPFLAITPSWVPAPQFVVAATGVCEIAGALGLLTKRFRRLAGAMLALYAVCVFPANIHHAWSALDVAGLPTSWLYHAPRLALQPAIVWWALFCAGIIDWPFASRAPR
jgi:uncharacterized membrane protein